jgi:hypothetical protein
MSAMNRDVTRSASQKQAAPERRWTRVVYDVTGIDGDIERVLGVLQKKHGYTRERANADLLRRLSFAAL